MNEKKLIERYLRDRGFRKTKGFAVDSRAMNPEEYEEVFFEGRTLNKAIEDYFRKVEYWIYEPSDGEQVFEDIDEALEYAEDNSEISFREFKKIVRETKE